MTLAALQQYLRDWGSLAVSVGSLCVAGWALSIGIANRRTLRREHGWKEEDRQREEARRKQEEARAEWCRKMVEVSAAGGPVSVPLEKLEWAVWGDGTFFTFRPTGPEGPYLVRLQG